ncbi:hypothetical protein PPACK8108_LOCUS9960 [Phakopsora pachyrhizi]|uniref:GYF domain-containing protein n=1 Tax=Phakopsora pachyrhizi TaxID=170000 RepID=A0AAV0AZF3_PHAPC|nr:hypothetical protein PPACK8108_LOCUS9960 [Phakopsora pachyrhizi]
MSNKRTLEASSSRLSPTALNSDSRDPDSQRSNSKKFKPEDSSATKGNLKRMKRKNESGDDEDTEKDRIDLDCDELNPIGKPRKGRVRVDGYDSDSSTENNEVREKQKEKKNDDDDMFGSGEEDEAKGSNKKNRKADGFNTKFEKIDVGMNLRKGAEAKDYLELGDIEGQEFGREMDEDEEEEEDEEDEEDYQLGRSRRKISKKDRSKGTDFGDGDGLEDDYSNEEEDYVPGDEFANDDDAPRARRKSKKGMGFVMSKFNMAEELREGRLTADGNYVPSAKDPEAAHDNWLEGVNKRAMKQAREAKKRQDEEIRRRAAMDNSLKKHRSRKDCYISLLGLLPCKSGKTVSQILAQLGNVKKTRFQSERRKVAKKPTDNSLVVESESINLDPTNKNYKNEQVDEKFDKSLAPDQKVITSTKSEEYSQIDQRITEITDLASTLMGNHGDLDIYDMTHGSIVGTLKSEALVPRDWIPPSDDSMSFLDLSTQHQHPNDSSSGASKRSLITRPATVSYPSSQPLQPPSNNGSDSIYYRFKPDPTNPKTPADVYGPFGRAMMEGWASQGFFGQTFEKIVVKLDNSPDGTSSWGDWNQIIH